MEDDYNPKEYEENFIKDVCIWWQSIVSDLVHKPGPHFQTFTKKMRKEFRDWMKIDSDLVLQMNTFVLHSNPKMFVFKKEKRSWDNRSQNILSTGIQTEFSKCV